MDYQTIIESFFSMLGRFDFDRSKSYIDGRKEVLQKLAPTFPNQAQLMTMLTAFSHLAEVEKNYHNQPFINQPQHSFLSSTNFLRKAKSLKDMYNDIHSELQQLEQLNPNTADKCESILSSASDNNLQKLFGKQSAPDSASNDTNNSNSSSTDKDSPGTQVLRSPGTSIRNSFFRVLLPISSSSSVAPQVSQTPLHSAPINDPYSLSSSSGYEPPPNSTTTTPISQSLTARDFSEELISHFCRQLQKFIQARLDMIDIYEQLVEALSRKYASYDSVAFDLSMLCRQYHKYFHHPLLAPIKEGMTLECESLMTLIRATIDMQHWRFLPTLFDLQDAQSKLNFWAASTFNKEASRRRFKVSKTQAAPRLYDWLCKFKDFLVSKFTLYFHSTLSRNFPLSNFKATCAKLSVDYYSKLSNFQRKADALFVALLFDVSNEKDFRGLGYNFPSKNYQYPQGKNTLQPMLVIPTDSRPKLNSLQAEIYMMIMTNSQIVIKEGHYQFHDNLKKLTYSITKPDLNIVLVIVCEGQKVDRDAHVRTSAMEITNQFAFLNILSS